MSQNNTNDLDYTILIRFIDGQTTPEETAAVTEWLAASPDNQALYFQVKDIFDQQLASSITPVEADQSWEKVITQLGAERSVPVRRLGWMKYAAAVLALLLVGGAGIYLWRKSNTPPAPMATLVSKKNTVQTILLPDSTRIWVKPGGSVKMKEGPNENTREVWLEGTAYFEVVKKAAVPFTVHVPDMTVTVLGTAFTINDRLQHPAVMVNSGLVKATAFNKELLVHPGERGMVTDSLLRIDHVNPQLYAAWKDGDYKFEETSIEEIRELLLANYGYEVAVIQPQKFRGTRISGHVLITDENSLCKVLGAMLNASVRKDGYRIIIQPK
ncbi:MAG: FecR domain-containing protein [Chitinophaga sp.]|uniref:FecR domain-containing protein n=1 Tax=Chitinophaga sp. TaxID=1869181 RepID=UPI001B107775|nr:FecR domain-containing protein [Chitinophaga sp.]MBO9730310.1 FecR domain-containing protein [Chitinophaga sp.]